jgi:hypothetical protein
MVSLLKATAPRHSHCAQRSGAILGLRSFNEEGHMDTLKIGSRKAKVSEKDRYCDRRARRTKTLTLDDISHREVCPSCRRELESRRQNLFNRTHLKALADWFEHSTRQCLIWRGPIVYTVTVHVRIG